jgi:malate/lactate dehydrogenase
MLLMIVQQAFQELDLRFQRFLLLARAQGADVVVIPAGVPRKPVSQ